MKTLNSIIALLLNALCFFFLVALTPSASSAQQVISYQGLVAMSGTPLQGPHNVALSIYTDSTAASAIYTESQHNVTFTDGLFNLQMGTNKANPLPVFDAGDYTGTVRPAPNYFLGVSIDGGAELSPRSKLGTSPTAWSSRFADSSRVAGTAATATIALNGLPRGAIIIFGDSGSHTGFSFTGGTSVLGNSWSNGAALPVPQADMTTAAVNGKIYVIGGVDGSMNDNQIYDPVANTWSSGAALPAGQYSMTSAVVNGKIYVIGGFNGSQNNTQIYDPVANTWSAGAVLPVAEYDMTSAAVNGKIYVFGGIVGTQNSTQIYDPVANSWSTSAALPVAQYYMTSAVFNGKIYVIGGYKSAGHSNQIYDPVANSWSTGAILPNGQAFTTSAVANGKIYVIGGYAGSQYNQIYDPVANTWSSGAAIPAGGAAATSVAVNGNIYVMGGSGGGGNGTSDYNQIYVPGLNLYYFSKN